MVALRYKSCWVGRSGNGRACSICTRSMLFSCLPILPSSFLFHLFAPSAPVSLSSTLCFFPVYHSALLWSSHFYHLLSKLFLCSRLVGSYHLPHQSLYHFFVLLLKDQMKSSCRPRKAVYKLRK